VLISDVALKIFTTHGRPYSRATTAPVNDNTWKLHNSTQNLQVRWGMFPTGNTSGTAAVDLHTHTGVVAITLFYWQKYESHICLVVLAMPKPMTVFRWLMQPTYQGCGKINSTYYAERWQICPYHETQGRQFLSQGRRWAGSTATIRHRCTAQQESHQATTITCTKPTSYQCLLS